MRETLNFNFCFKRFNVSLLPDGSYSFEAAFLGKDSALNEDGFLTFALKNSAPVCAEGSVCYTRCQVLMAEREKWSDRRVSRFLAGEGARPGVEPQKVGRRIFRLQKSKLLDHLVLLAVCCRLPRMCHNLPGRFLPPGSRLPFFQSVI